MAEIRQKIVTFVIFTFICIFTNISVPFMDNIHKYMEKTRIGGAKHGHTYRHDL